MNELTSVVCLTIVAESVLERRLVDLVREAGAKGWTLTAARGSGPRGRRVSEAEGGNVRIEVLVPEAVASTIWRELHEHYLPHYAVVAWQQEVLVARRSLFGS